jgi:hypothetical protein
MKIAIIGSPDFPELEQVDAFIDTLSLGDVVISGGAPGVDSRAESRARSRGLEVLVLLPSRARDGRVAVFKRNHALVAAADRVVAFWEGTSRRTGHTVMVAYGAGKPVRVFLPTSVR